MGYFSRVLFLGTSSGVPLPGKRNVSSLAIQLSSGRGILVDCGEGTQHQLMQSNIRMNKISAVFLTHLHGDHCYGIFGFVHSLNMGGRTDPLKIYGPVGINELISTVFRLTGGWHGYPLDIVEIDTTCVHSFEVSFSSSEKLAVTTCPMVHRIEAIGYVFKESDHPPKLDVDKARALGVPMDSSLSMLKKGEPVTLANGMVIRLADVSDSTAKPARVIAVMQDTSDSSAAHPFLLNCDMLIHESTYENALIDKAIEYGHCTAGYAGKVARLVNAKTLVLTHFSPRLVEEKLIAEAEYEASPESRVIVAEDFMEISFNEKDIGGVSVKRKCILNT